MLRVAIHYHSARIYKFNTVKTAGFLIDCFETSGYVGDGISRPISGKYFYNGYTLICKCFDAQSCLSRQQQLLFTILFLHYLFHFSVGLETQKSHNTNKDEADYKNDHFIVALILHIRNCSFLILILFLFFYTHGAVLRRTAFIRAFNSARSNGFVT